MQGRLSPPEQGRFQSFPRANWKSEIELVPLVPLRGIEWLFDRYGEGFNPLETPVGRAFLASKLQESGVSVISVCADRFVEQPLFGVDRETLRDRIETLKWLISGCAELSVERIVLPFVDASRMRTSQDYEDVLWVLSEALPQASDRGVELHLECDLAPMEFRSFLKEIRDPLVKVNYDSGNSAAMGFAVADEFEAYGPRIGSVHIKDRLFRAGTVALGTGDTDFAALRSALADVEYRGHFVLQAARGAPGVELEWMSRNAAIAGRWLRGDSSMGEG